MRSFAWALCVPALLFSACASWAAEKPVEAMLPSGFATIWAMEGTIASYTPENLYRYIDGEAELYLPYGFTKAATARYVKAGGGDVGMVVNIFEMGSPLDAFGIYSNYRSPALKKIEMGTEGFLDESQVMFYQDRYFVQIEASGTLTQESAAFLVCGQAISAGLPQRAEKPPELELLKIGAAVPMTEKYYAAGLLGYGFMGRGLTEEAVLEGVLVKPVVALAASEEAAKKVLEDYQNYLKKARVEVEVAKDKGGLFLHAADPLYKGVAFLQTGRYVVGVVGLDAPHEGDELVASLAGRLPGTRE